MPNEENCLQICSDPSGIRIYDRDDLIVELKENRWLRFRSNGKTERWIGGEGHGSDQCVAYDERHIAPIAVQKATATRNGRDFTVCVESEKTAVNASVSFRLQGEWQAKADGYAYTLCLAMNADTEEWYRKSFVAQAYERQVPPKRPRIQMFDYRIELVSDIQRRSTQTLRTHPLYYKWFFSSPDGVAFEKWPKIHVAYPGCAGNYPTIRTGDRMKPGACYGFADAEGGWITRVQAASAPVNFELCWAALDVHVFLYDALPLRGEAERFSAELALTFEPLNAAEASAILSAAAERDWRSEPTYDLPAISPEPQFDCILSELPSEETEPYYFWRGSDADCTLDRTAGRGKCALAIRKTANAQVPYAAWNTYNWPLVAGLHTEPYQRWKFSALVKTEQCAGAVRLVYAAGKNGTELFYGNGTHDAKGNRRTDIIDWYESPALSGTNDWTRLELVFTVQRGTGCVILEQIGTGQSRFDAVHLEQIGTVSPADFRRTEDFSDGSAEGWFCTNTRYPAHTDEGIEIPRTFPGSLSVQTNEKACLVLSTDGVSLPVPLTLRKRLMPLNRPFVLCISEKPAVRRAVLLASEAFGAVQWAEGFLLLPDGTSVAAGGEITLTVQCAAGEAALTVVSERGTHLCKCSLHPTDAEEIELQIPAGECGMIQITHFEFRFLPEEA